MGRVDRAMAARPHEIAGDEIKTNRRAPPDYAKKLESKHSVNELFIGDYKAEISEDDLKKHFSKFGNVTDVAVPKKESGELRGFAIVTFDDYDAVDVCSFKKLHYIGENRLVVSKYIDKKTMNSLHYKYNKNNEYSNALTDDPNLNEILKGVLTLQLANVLDNQGEDGSSSNKNRRKGKRKKSGCNYLDIYLCCCFLKKIFLPVFKLLSVIRWKYLCCFFILLIKKLLI